MYKGGKVYTEFLVSDFLTLKYSQTVGVNTISTEIPTQFYLKQNYPNPFNPSTNLEIGPRRWIVSLKVFDASGKEVAVLVN